MEVRYVHPHVETFLSGLEKPTRTKVTRLVELLAERRQRLGMPFSRNLGNGLYELRILGIQNVRIFYTFLLGEVVLLHGVSKKTQKVAQRDIETARQHLVLLHEA